ncbi:MAG: sulfite exporter TauE/SafE family protein [Alphaproteobacteria bacterium]|nr:sulfite exporter TauE/SafE family protein [Alphaproteobacteria bacterium]
MIPSPLELFLASAVMAVGCAFQAAVGVGMALLVVPILALIDTQFVPGPMLFAGTALAAATAWRDRAAIDARLLALSIVGLALGTAIGALALTRIAGPDLPKLFGGLILAAVLISLVGRRIVATRGLVLGGATASGVLGTMVGIHGPPIALVFQNAAPDRARAMLGAFFAVGYATAVGSLALVGLFGAHEAMLGAALLPGVAAGWLAAPAIARFIDPARLRVAILLVSAASAVALLLR